MRYNKLAMALAASTALAQETPSLIQALNSTADLSMLNTLIGSSPGLPEILARLTNITVLAPNNAAIEAFAKQNNASLSDAAFVAATLTYHVLNGTYANFTNSSQFISTALAPGQFANVTGGQVVEARLNNGTPTFFSGYTMNSTAIGAPVTIQGGVVHIIDKVLTVPANISTTATDLGLSSAAGALVNASLVQTVDTTANLTLFAPNNEAFQAIGSALPGLTIQQLTGILEYHVVPQVAYSSSLSNTTIPSLQGTDLTITVYNSTSIYVNNARVITPDVLVANGVVHVIDEVLNPGNATATKNEPAFPGVTSASEPPFTSQAPSTSRSINPSDVPTVTSTSSPGAGWKVKPTGLAAVLVAGAAVLVL